jgi:MFS family permease
VAGLIFGGRISGSAEEGYAQALDFIVAGTGSLSGGTISVLIVQEAALGIGLTSIAIFPVLIAALQGLIGFPLTSLILRKEAARLRDEYRAGTLEAPVAEDPAAATATRLPEAFRTTAGTLFVVGVTVLVALGINNLTDGILNTFVVALILGIALRTTGVFKPSVLSGIDAFGLMMISILILVFAPLATVEPSDVAELAFPLLLAFLFGIVGIAAFAALVGKFVGYSVPMSVAIGLTSLYGFPGTMILSQEAAKGAGETEEEVKAIEGEILPKMIVAGFSTVTITSVVVTSIIAGFIGG